MFVNKNKGKICCAFVALCLSVLFILPSATTEGTESDNRPVHSAPSLFLALSVGNEEVEKRSAVSRELIGHILARHLGDGSRSSCFLLKDKAYLSVWEDRILNNEEDFDELLSLYRRDVTENRIIPADAISSLCNALNTKAQAAGSGPMEIWFLEQRPPADTTKNRDKYESAALSLVELLTNFEEAAIHFVYIGQEDPLREGFDDFTRSVALSKSTEKTVGDRIYTYRLADSSGTELAEAGSDAFIRLVRTQWQAWITGTATGTSVPEEAYQWSFTFQNPSKDCTKALLFLSFPDQLTSPRFSLEPSEKEQPPSENSPQILVLSGREELSRGSVWILVDGLSAENYRFSLTSDSSLSDAVPIVEIFHVPPARTVWVADEISSTWFRRVYRLVIKTDAVDVSPEQWKLKLLVNGIEQEILQEPEILSSSGDFYSWAIQVPPLLPGKIELLAALTLNDPSGKTLTTESFSLEVLNQSPQLKGEAYREYTCFVDRPWDSAAQEKELIIDLDELFHDPDGDPLHFLLEDPAYREYENPRVEGSQFRFVPYLSYTKDCFTVQALDGFGLPLVNVDHNQEAQGSEDISSPAEGELEHSFIVANKDTDAVIEDSYSEAELSEASSKTDTGSVRICIEQISLRNLLDSWRFSLFSVDGIPYEEGGLPSEFTVNRDVSLLYRCENQENLTLFREASESLSLSEIEGALKIYAAEMSSMELKDYSVYWDNSSPAAVLCIELMLKTPPVFSGLSSFAFTAEYQGYPLENAAPPPVEFNITNTRPFLREEETLLIDVRGLIKGDIPAHLSEILGQELDLYKLFDDLETPSALSFFVKVDGIKAEILLNRLPVPPVESTDESGLYHLVISPYEIDADKEKSLPGDMMLEVLFPQEGEGSVSVWADDGENQSEPYQITIRIESWMKLLLKKAGIVLLAVSLLVLLVSFLVWRSKPSFRGISIEISTSQIREEGSVSSNLDSYGKKPVELAALIIACRQPPPAAMDFLFLTDILVRPSKNNGVKLISGAKARNSEIRLERSPLPSKKNLGFNTWFSLENAEGGCIHFRFWVREERV